MKENAQKIISEKRRGVTDIISTMMLMAVTVAGASTLTYFMNDAFVDGNLGTISTLDSSSLNLLLLAYDTRDSSTLLMIHDVDNENSMNSFLCASTCAIDVNEIPESGGTEFIVMRIQNNSLDSMFLEDVVINNVSHSWDLSTSGVQLDASTNDLSGPTRDYPADGMFSILPTGSTPITQKENTEIQSGEIVHILVKLGPEDADIALNSGIGVLLNVGSVQPVEFLLESGNAQ